MYDTDVLSEGQIGGHCKLNKESLKENLDFMGSLQSWAPEIQYFTELPEVEDGNFGGSCDKVVSLPTIIMKIDASKFHSSWWSCFEAGHNLGLIILFLAVNMYHHFCDFFNLYASLHVNATRENPEAFSRQTQILIWRTFPYQSNFQDIFKTFTENPILDLNAFAGKKICFKNVIFPLLPRMIFGLFYNTPLVRINDIENSNVQIRWVHFVLFCLECDLELDLGMPAEWIVSRVFQVYSPSSSNRRPTFTEFSENQNHISQQTNRPSESAQRRLTPGKASRKCRSRRAKGKSHCFDAVDPY